MKFMSMVTLHMRDLCTLPGATVNYRNLQNIFQVVYKARVRHYILVRGEAKSEKARVRIMQYTALSSIWT